VTAASGLAFKAYEIEEFVDIHFFRRAGILIAHAARVLGLSPNAVSIVSGAVGGVGGALLVSDRWVPLGVTLIVAHGVFDSADGQLARMTGRTSELGRLLDGAGGYVTHVAAYLAIFIRMLAHGGSWWMLGLALLAGAATAVHAQLYDYHRTTYAAIVLKGRARGVHGPGQVDAPNAIVRVYERIQRRLAGWHPAVEALIGARAVEGVVRDEDRERYRECFYRPVRGWNLFGDNVRRLGFVVLAWLHHLEWYFAFILLPLNVLLVVVWLWQRQVDRRYLDVTARRGAATR
jgi:phosphatidylglycerophosphate synthase